MATNFVNASYTEVIDLQTVNGQTSVIGIHTPVGYSPYTRLKGFFDQFRKFKYNGITSLTMVPAAQLPVDPLGLTGVQGTTDLMDPRDQLNPILFHGCHGENLTQILNTIYGANSYVSETVSTGGNPVNTLGNVSASADESLVPNALSDLTNYYRCLTDTTWKKFGIQQGVHLKHLHPLVWKVAQNHDQTPNVQYPNAGQTVLDDNSFESSSAMAGFDAHQLKAQPDPTEYAVLHNADVYSGEMVADNRALYSQRFTNGCSRLGWLPTSTFPISTSVNGAKSYQTCLPRLYMGVLILPPAYNVEQFFRLVIRHSFSFRDFTTSLGLMGYGAYGTGANFFNEDCYWNWIDYDTDGTVVTKSVSFDQGPTLDVIAGKSEVVSDGVS